MIFAETPFSITGNQNLGSNQTAVKYFLQQTNIPVQSINDAISRLTVGYTFEIDQSPPYAEIVAVVRGLRSAAWMSALSMKTSANREIEIGKLIIQEEYFLTNIYGALAEEYGLGNSTENISRIKAGVRLNLQSKSHHTRHVLHPL